MTISDQEQYARYCAENPVEAVKQRISIFLDAIEVKTLSDAEAEIASWEFTDITNDSTAENAFRVYRDPDGNRYVCATEQAVRDLANSYEDYECVTPDCSAHVDEPGELCDSCTAWLEAL